VPHIAQEAHGRVSADQGMDQGKPSPERGAIRQGTQSAAARALQLLRSQGQQRFAPSLLQVAHSVFVQMA